jgi:hypothetical protein
MTKDKLLQFIREILPMSPSRAEQVAAKFQPAKVDKNAYILNEVTTAFYPSNTYASELLSFFKRTPAREYIQAITDCLTWSISYEDMQESFHTIPEFREYGRLNIVSQYSLLKERMLSNLQETAEKRYDDLIHAHPELLQQVPLKYIASYLGIADTSLSRIRAAYSKK